MMTFPANSTEYSRWIESFSWGGEFTWHVLAFDEEGKEICRSTSTKFTKPVTEPSQTAVPRKGKSVNPATPIVPTPVGTPF